MRHVLLTVLLPSIAAAGGFQRLHADQASATSYLKSNWNKYEENYHPSYVLDDDPKTAWVEATITTHAIALLEGGKLQCLVILETVKDEMEGGTVSVSVTKPTYTQGQLPQSTPQLSGVEPVPQLSVTWQTPSPQL